MGINAHDWQRKTLQKLNQNLRGTSQSSGRSAVGPRGIAKGIIAGGFTGGGIGLGAINTDQMGNVQESTAFNNQHSILPIVTDLSLTIESFTAPNYSLDIRLWGQAGSTSATLATRPDGSQLYYPQVGIASSGGHTYYDLGSNFGSSAAVYAMVYFNLFAFQPGEANYEYNNGTAGFIVNWQTIPFTAQQLASGFADGCTPILCTPANTNTGLVAGTSGTINSNFTGPNF